MSLPAPISAKIARLIPMLGSDQDGEVVAAVRAIRRTLAAAGQDLHDLARRLTGGTSSDRYHKPDAGAVTPLVMVHRCLELDRGRLSPREREFLQDLRRWLAVGQPSPKQLTWLRAIHNKLGEVAR